MRMRKNAFNVSRNLAYPKQDLHPFKEIWSQWLPFFVRSRVTYGHYIAHRGSSLGYSKTRRSLQHAALPDRARAQGAVTKCREMNAEGRRAMAQRNAAAVIEEVIQIGTLPGG